MKIVIDTNLLVAGIFNKKSHSYKIIEKAQKGEVKVLWSNDIKKEAGRIVDNIRRSLTNTRFQNSAKKIKKSLGDIFKEEGRVKHPPKVDVIKADPEDNKFLACAKKGRADLIISNDSHLLNLKEFNNIPILEPTNALQRIK